MRLIRKDAGMSMISVLVATAILGILASGIVSMVVFTSKTVSGTDQKVDFLDLRDSLNRTVSFAGLCRDAFQTISVGGTAGSNVDLPSLQLTQYRLDVNQPLPGSQITITRMRLTTVTNAQATEVESPSSAGTILTLNRHGLSLEIRGSKSNAAAGGGLIPITVTFMALVNQTTDAIVECAVETNISQACQETGGYYNSSRVLEGRCQLRGLRTGEEYFLKADPSSGSASIPLTPTVTGANGPNWEICTVVGSKTAGATSTSGCRVSGTIHGGWTLFLQKSVASDPTVECWAYCANSW